MRPLVRNISPHLLRLLLVCIAAPACVQARGADMPERIVIAQETAIGWSVKKSLLGKTVYNEKNERVGIINDLLIGQDSTISHVIVAAGGFVGKGRHDVAIEMGSLELRNGKFFVEGATRENIRATPTFEYASKN